MLGESQCITIADKDTVKSPAKTMHEKSYGKICNKYLKSICPYGISGKGCNLYHPKMCRPFTKFGPKGKRGCNKGDSCSYFHPKLCFNSLKPVTQRVCTNQTCGFFHLPKTRRFPIPDNRLPFRERQTAPFRERQPYVSSKRPVVTPLPRDDHFLAELITKIVKENIHAELMSFPNLATSEKVPPFLPGMRHFSQPPNPASQNPQAPVNQSYFQPQQQPIPQWAA